MREIEITAGINGYPSHLHKGYIDFCSFNEAKAFAKAVGGKVVELVKRDGWSFWKSNGTVFGPLVVDAEIYGDDFSTINSLCNWDNNCRERLSWMIKDKVPFSDIIIAIGEMETVREKIDLLGENEAVLLCRNKYYDIIETRTTHYREDVWQHEIGVEL